MIGTAGILRMLTAEPGPDPAPDCGWFIADVARLVVGRGTDEKVLIMEGRPDGDRRIVVSAFLERDLIDELVITRAPIVLGEGLPLFHALPRSTRLVQLGSSTIEAGMSSSRYRVERATD